jgi:hypothetical protein
MDVSVPLFLSCNKYKSHIKTRQTRGGRRKHVLVGIDVVLGCWAFELRSRSIQKASQHIIRLTRPFSFRRLSLLYAAGESVFLGVAHDGIAVKLGKGIDSATTMNCAALLYG